MCEMDRACFDMLWAESTSQDQTIEIDNMMQFDLFKLISVQTQHKIVHECGHKFKFEPGTKILPWHIRSPWNEKGYRIYKYNKPVINTLDEANAGGMGIGNSKGNNKRESTPGFEIKNLSSLVSEGNSRKLSIKGDSKSKKNNEESLYIGLAAGLHLAENGTPKS